MGFFGVLLLTIIIHLSFEKTIFINGFFWGIALSYCGLLLFTFIPNFKSKNGYSNLSIFEYLFRSVVRMSTLLILFAIIVLVLKVSAFGLLVGSFIGMICLSFIFLFKMKPSQ